MSNYVGSISKLLLGLSFIYAAPVYAGDALQVELVPKVLRGNGHPSLVVKAEVALEQVTLTVTRASDGKVIRQKSGPIAAGREHKFHLKLKKGKSKFSGRLTVEMSNGQSGEMPIEVEAAIIEPIKLTIESSDLDLKSRQFKLRADRDVAKIQVSVMSDTGTPLGTVEHSWNGRVQPADQKFMAKWKQSKGTVMRITVKAWDSDDFYGAIELFPWKVEIPHEEVNFDSGSSTIIKEEEPKLHSSLSEIRQAISKYGSLAKIRLFIAGHTDTVGDAASNRSLSKARARSIGIWFRKQGIKIPILSAGLGEDQLVVDTPDNIDEVRNRRAEYVVAVEAPALAGSANWKKL